MKDFTGKLAVITGGGTGMGRELARALVAEGCNVAMCDVSAANMATTKAQCEEAAAQGTRVTTFVADVSDRAAMEAFAAATARDQQTDKVHLLFNNAGIGGGGSFVAGDEGEWKKTFDVCWGGVYNGVRVFLPMMMAADEAHIVNTSSVNGFWASLGPRRPHTAYAAAKFAVRGFSEALMADLEVNAPHIKVSVVMPGHIGTEIVANSRKVLTGDESDTLGSAGIAQARARLAAMGMDAAALSDAELAALSTEMQRRFRDEAPTSAAEAAAIILDGVREDRWRILVGEDAKVIDSMVRAEPEAAYESEFFTRMAAAAGWRLGG
ncbi:MAG TPA: SDR family NAD(P)-dependent oxidoreductase [Caulobacteraceae bacterium]|nr:SDR family NAD(P)-dependent oxidoreductase [Caulobacteraceae bacterium]